MSRQTIINRMNFLRTLYCETKGETKQEFRLLYIIRNSLIDLNKRLAMYPHGEQSTFRPVATRVDVLTK